MPLTSAGALILIVLILEEHQDLFKGMQRVIVLFILFCVQVIDNSSPTNTPGINLCPLLLLEALERLGGRWLNN